MLELNKSNFNKEIGKGKVIVKYTANWCGPCKAMAPIFEGLSKEIKDVKFVKLDVDKNPEIASQHGVMSIPTFIIFKDGKEVDRIIGGNSKDTFKTKIKDAVKN